MKPVIVAVIGLFITASLCAQARLGNRIQRGVATQEMDAEGMYAAHPKIPVNSKVKITNTQSGVEIVATIVGNIPESKDRIIDLSRSAALSLGISLGTGARGFVAVEMLSLPPEPVPEPVKEPEKPSSPIALTINNYISNTEDHGSGRGNRERDTGPVTEPPVSPASATAKTPPPQPAQPPAVAPPPQSVAQQPVQSTSAATAPPPQPAPQQPTQPVAASVAPPPQPAQPTVAVPPPQPTTQQPVQSVAVESPPPVQSVVQPPPQQLNFSPPAEIKVLPKLPNADSGKIYKLLVGTYVSLDEALQIYRQLQAASFKADQEQAGNLYRVFAIGIPASNVYFAAQRLGSIGFKQVWVQE